jgi:hypothetical protein
MKERSLKNEVKRVIEPFLWGSAGVSIFPTARRYFKKNPAIENPDKEDYDKLYWANHPRSTIAFVSGVLVGSLGATDVIQSGLEEAVNNNNYIPLLFCGGVFVGTNLASGIYEMCRKYY